MPVGRRRGRDRGRRRSGLGDERVGRERSPGSIRGPGSSPRPVNVGHGASAVAVGAGARLGRQHAGRHGLASRSATSNNVLATIAVGAGPTGLAVTADGKAVLVTSEISRHRLARRRRERASDSLTTSNRPQAVATPGGAIYVAVRTSGLSASRRRADRAHPHSDRLDRSRGRVRRSPGVGAHRDQRRTGRVQARRRQRRARGSCPTSRRRSRPRLTAGTTYTFQIRRGIRYSNGAPLRPADFRRGIERSVVAYCA